MKGVLRLVDRRLDTAKTSNLSSKQRRFMYSPLLDGLEIIVDRNPRGGKPQKIGATVQLGLERQDTLMDIGNLPEDTSTRFILGYCPCGCKKKIIAGERMTLFIVFSVLKRLHMTSFDELKDRMKEIFFPQGRPQKPVYWEDFG